MRDFVKLTLAVVLGAVIASVFAGGAKTEAAGESAACAAFRREASKLNRGEIDSTIRAWRFGALAGEFQNPRSKLPSAVPASEKWAEADKLAARKEALDAIFDVFCELK